MRFTPHLICITFEIALVLMDAAHICVVHSHSEFRSALPLRTKILSAAVPSATHRDRAKAMSLLLLHSSYWQRLPSQFGCDSVPLLEMAAYKFAVLNGSAHVVETLVVLHRSWQALGAPTYPELGSAVRVWVRNSEEKKYKNNTKSIHILQLAAHLAKIIIWL